MPRKKNVMYSKKLHKKINLEHLKSISVLLVEDNIEVQEQLSLFLKNKVKSLYTALNGREGVESFKANKPDVIITDIRMPVMSGLEMAEKIRSVDQDIPIIVTTAFNEQDYFIKSIDISIDKYVIKPTDPYLLLDALIKTSRSVIQKREVELNVRFVRFMLDANPCLLATGSRDRIEYINKTFLSFLGFSSVEDFFLSGKKIYDFFLKVESEAESNPGKESWQDLVVTTGSDVFVHMKQFDEPNDSIKVFLVTYSRFSELDRYIFSFTDITRIDAEKQTLKIQADTDALTGLYNRKKFTEILKAEISRTKRYLRPLSIIMFDIDHFKAINDTYGHDEGDYVLKKMSEIVSKNIRDNDTFIRWGGEEFFIIAPETDLNRAKLLAEKLCLIFRNGFVFRTVGVVTCSYGVVQYKEGYDIDTFVKHADNALYLAKKKGRCRVEG